MYVYIRFNSSETTKRTDIKLSTIDHYLKMSVIRMFVTYHDVMNKDNLSYFTFFNCAKPFCTQKKATTQPIALQKISSLCGQR